MCWQCDFKRHTTSTCATSMFLRHLCCTGSCKTPGSQESAGQHPARAGAGTSARTELPGQGSQPGEGCRSTKLTGQHGILYQYSAATWEWLARGHRGSAEGSDACAQAQAVAHKQAHMEAQSHAQHLTAKAQRHAQARMQAAAHVYHLKRAVQIGACLAHLCFCALHADR